MDTHGDNGDVADDDIEIKPRELRGPIPTGSQTARINRPGHDGGPDTQLRVAADLTAAGEPVVSLRIWEKNGQTETWWPTRQGLTFRPDEGREVLAALNTALVLAADDRVVEEIRAHNAWLIEPFEDGSSLAHPRRRPRPIAAPVNLTLVSPPEPEPAPPRVPIGRVRGRKMSKLSRSDASPRAMEDE